MFNFLSIITYKYASVPWIRTSWSPSWTIPAQESTQKIRQLTGNRDRQIVIKMGRLRRGDPKKVSDEDAEERLNKLLVDSGERDRLRERLSKKLDADGWREEVKVGTSSVSPLILRYLSLIMVRWPCS